MPEATLLQAIGVSPQHTLITSPNKSTAAYPSPHRRTTPASTSASAVVSPFGRSASPNLQIQTGSSPQHSLPQSQQLQVGHSRTRSGSTSGIPALGAPPPHPPAGPHSAQDGRSGTRRRASLSANLPGSGPSPFELLEQSLRKNEKHETSHPIDPALYDRPERAATPTSPFSATAPVNGIVLPTRSTTAPVSPQPRSASVTQSPSGQAAATPRSQPPSPLPVSSTSPSTSSFQPVLSYRSKLTALDIALSELVDERRLLDTKTAEEKARMEEEITRKKKEMEATVWEGEKHAALMQGEVDAERQRLTKLEAESARLRELCDSKVKELEAAAEQKRSEAEDVRRAMAADEQSRKALLEDCRSKVAQYRQLRDDLSRDREKEQTLLIQSVLDLMLGAAVDLEAVKKEIDSRTARA